MPSQASPLSVAQITPVNFSAMGVEDTWKKTLASTANPRLRHILEIRSAIQDVIVGALRRKGYVHPPTYMFSTCVDPLNHATEAARFSYYGQECSLMQSLIFHKMALLALSSLDSVFWISPNVRKEQGVSDLGRYATEFTQIDFESSRLTMESAMALIEEIACQVVNTLAESHGEAIAEVSGRRLRPIQQPLQVFDVEDEAIRRGVTPSAIEGILAAEIHAPCFLVNLKREAYDLRDESTGKYRNYDLIMPITGEVLSGGEREHTHQRLELRMRELGYPLEYFEPVLRLAREQGLKPSAGAGFGLERFVRGVCLLGDIGEIYPFPRRPGEPIVF